MKPVASAVQSPARMLKKEVKEGLGRDGDRTADRNVNEFILAPAPSSAKRPGNRIDAVRRGA